MATIRLPSDFKEFLRLLNANGIEYLVVGGYAVGYHGYPRATVDLDVWIATSDENADKTVAVLKQFGFDVAGLSTDLFRDPDQIIRMGVPPVRIEIMTGVSGLCFEDAYACRVVGMLDDVEVSLVSLPDLKHNKRMAGRHKDLDDLENLPA